MIVYINLLYINSYKVGIMGNIVLIPLNAVSSLGTRAMHLRNVYIYVYDCEVFINVVLL